MDPVTMRRYEGEPDLAPMQALLRADPSPFDIYPSASDLPAVLDPSVSDTPDHTALWEDAQGDLVGFAMVTQCGNLHARFSPREWMEKVGPELVAWAVARLHLRAGNVTGLTLNAVARDDDALMTHFFVEHGFGEVPDSTFHMSRSLDRVLPTVDLPSGFSLRPLDGDSEVPAYVAVHRAAYGTEKMTEELRRSIMHQPHYDPALDLVVVAPDGRLAAFCVCSLDPAENQRLGRNEGEIGIVGVHPAYRGRGLGWAAGLAGLHALQGKGAHLSSQS